MLGGVDNAIAYITTDRLTKNALDNGYCIISHIYFTGSEQPNCNNSASLVNSNSSMTRCPQEDWTVPVVAAVYLLLSNLLLINLVIAKFRCAL